MVITLDLKTIGWALVIIGIIVLLVFCIILIKNLIATVKQVNRILSDAEQVSTIAAARTTQINNAVDSVTETIKNKPGVTSTLSSIANALISIKNLVDKK